MPAVYRKGRGRIRHLYATRQTDVMMARHLFRWPFRTLSSTVGVAMSVAILVASLWSFGSISHMIDVTFFRSERHDAMLVFGTPEPVRALDAARQMPGVMVAEPFRAVAARISHRNLSKRLEIMGKIDDPKLSRVLGPALRPMTMPQEGLLLSEALAKALDVRPGEYVTVEILEGTRPTVSLPVSGISVGYVGLGAAISLAKLNRIMQEGALISGLNLKIDAAARADFFSAAKAMPKTEFVTVTALTVARFKQTLAENIAVMITVYVILAAIIAVGVVYNFTRISLSEQGRELASLRVLGFTRAEVAGVLFGELAAVVLLAQPLGWLIGYGIGRAMVAAFSSDLYRVPFVVGRDVYATASLVVFAAAIASAWAIRARINSLDMIEVLKTRE
jgi:putative ABC transport system permease protein